MPFAERRGHFAGPEVEVASKGAAAAACPTAQACLRRRPGHAEPLLESHDTFGYMYLTETV